MASSILDDTKQLCGIEPDYDHYDLDIMMHINSVFATLNQLGIGPPDGFEISGNVETWDDFLAGNKKFNSVRTYLALKVKSLFDPPTTSFHISAMEDQLQQFEWRLNVVREETEWVDSTAPVTE